MDVTRKSHGGARPLARGEAPRKVTSGDIVGMFQRHAEMSEG